MMPTVDEICAAAASQVGIKEYPPDSNCVLYNTWFYNSSVSGSAYPWCMTFMQWLAHITGLPVLKTASCSSLASWARQQGQWVTNNFRRGDWVEFDFSGKRKSTQHVGLVMEVCAGKVHTIEGNTGSGKEADGGEVQYRIRSNSLITGAWRPTYAGQETTQAETRYQRVKDIPDTFRQDIQRLVEAGVLRGYKTPGDDVSSQIVDLSHDMVRVLVSISRAGVFDAALSSDGTKSRDA